MIHRLLLWARPSNLWSMSGHWMFNACLPVKHEDDAISIHPSGGVAAYKRCQGSKKHHTCALVTFVLQKTPCHTGWENNAYSIKYIIHKSELIYEGTWFFFLVFLVFFFLNQAGIDLSISEGLHLKSFEHTWSDDQTDVVNWQANVDTRCGHMDSGMAQTMPWT